MATAGTEARTHDRIKNRRPFSHWVKRLASLKGGSASHHDKKSRGTKRQANGNGNGNGNNPYPESGFSSKPAAPSTISGRASSFTPASIDSGRVGSFTSYEDSTGGKDIPLRSNKSTAPTLATMPGTINSDAGYSRAGTTHTDGIYSHSGRANSTFSSPQASQESLTTTLTTIQSTAPSAMLPTNLPTNTQSPVTFSHQYPISPPASAVPNHLQPSAHPNTYSAATANGLLTDDASIMTLASSTKRRRRNSADTNASVRAIAPSSVWGNSRESLPLSVLSQNIDRDPTGSVTTFPAGGPAGRPSLSGLASAERASVYSNPGVGAPALISERNSYYSTKAAAIDSISVRSGHLGLGHGRSESINGSISGLAAASPLASPLPAEAQGRESRRASGWKAGDGGVEEESEGNEDEIDDDDDANVGQDGKSALEKVDSKKNEAKGKGKEVERYPTPVSRKSSEQGH